MRLIPGRLPGLEKCTVIYPAGAQAICLHAAGWDHALAAIWSDGRELYADVWDDFKHVRAHVGIAHYPFVCGIQRGNLYKLLAPAAWEDTKVVFVEDAYARRGRIVILEGLAWPNFSMPTGKTSTPAIGEPLAMAVIRKPPLDARGLASVLPLWTTVKITGGEVFFDEHPVAVYESGGDGEVKVCSSVLAKELTQPTVDKEVALVISRDGLHISLGKATVTARRVK